MHIQLDVCSNFAGTQYHCIHGGNSFLLHVNLLKSCIEHQKF